MRHGRHHSLRVRSLKTAYRDFMNAPASGGYGSNQGVVLSVMGHSHVKDCPGFDSVRMKYHVPRACTFEQAFRACWHGRRDWRDFDLETLQDCHAEFKHLTLPEYVFDLLEREAIATEHERAMGEHGDEAEYAAPVDTDAPPLELLHRSGPRRLRRNRGPRSRAARGKSGLARAYRAAKRQYHKLGEQLHWANLKGTLL